MVFPVWCGRTWKVCTEHWPQPLIWTGTLTVSQTWSPEGWRLLEQQINERGFEMTHWTIAYGWDVQVSTYFWHCSVPTSGYETMVETHESHSRFWLVCCFAVSLGCSTQVWAWTPVMFLSQTCLCLAIGVTYWPHASRPFFCLFGFLFYLLASGHSLSIVNTSNKSQSWLAHTACCTFLKVGNAHPHLWGGHNVTFPHFTPIYFIGAKVSFIPSDNVTGAEWNRK